MIMTGWFMIEATSIDGQQRSHLVGHVVCGRRRVSSEIKKFIPEIKTVITCSDQVYRLGWRPGVSFNGDKTLENWKHANKVRKYQVITDKYLAALGGNG